MKLRFTDTFANRVKLADAYLEAGLTDKALEIYTKTASPVPLPKTSMYRPS
jgi:hypothetical protein